MRIPGLNYWTPKKDLARLCEPFLEPGEQISHLLIAYQSMMEPHWVVAVTDRAILVLDPGVVRAGFARWIGGQRVRRLPRATRLGPVYGQGWIVLDGQRFFVPGKKRAIATIDAEAGFPLAD